MATQVTLRMDVETRCVLPLDDAGAWRYAELAELLCWAWAVDDDDVELWQPERGPLPADLRYLLTSGDVQLEAHNAGFERAIMHHGRKRHGIPETPLRRWSCSMAKCGAHGLPQGLDAVAEALRLPADLRKDDDGHKLMLAMAEPGKAAEGVADLFAGYGPVWRDTPQDRARLGEYCRQDVVCERAISKLVPDLSEREAAVWRADQAINERGFPLDRAYCERAVRLVAEHKRRIDSETARDYGVRATQRAKFAARIRELHGIELADTKASTVQRAARATSDPAALRALQLFAEAGSTSLAKYGTALAETCSDGRIRGSLRIYGAGPGRWAGRGFQPHNLPAARLHPIFKADPLEGYKDVATLDYDALAAKYGEVAQALSSGLRGAIAASPGHRFAVGDYAAIEARVLFVESGDDDAVALLAAGEDIYADFASKLYRRKITGGVARDRLGKPAILGLGYAMGAPRFLVTCDTWGLTFGERECRAIVGAEYGERSIETRARIAPPEERERITLQLADIGCTDAWDLIPQLTLARYVVETYRRTHPAVQAWHREQERQALEALRTTRPCGDWRMDSIGGVDFLAVALPSGRSIFYRDPGVAECPATRIDRRSGAEVEYLETRMTYLTPQGARVSTYGGMLVENRTQGVSRDVLADKLVECEAAGLPTVLHVHDEGIVEARYPSQAERFSAVLNRPVSWMPDLPLVAEVGTLYRYQK